MIRFEYHPFLNDLVYYVLISARDTNIRRQNLE